MLGPALELLAGFVMGVTSKTIPEPDNDGPAIERTVSNAGRQVGKRVRRQAIERRLKALSFA